jgi:hypothetical protein
MEPRWRNRSLFNCWGAIVPLEGSKEEDWKGEKMETIVSSMCQAWCVKGAITRPAAGGGGWRGRVGGAARPRMLVFRWCPFRILRLNAPQLWTGVPVVCA